MSRFRTIIRLSIGLCLNLGVIACSNDAAAPPPPPAVHASGDASQDSGTSGNAAKPAPPAIAKNAAGTTSGSLGSDLAASAAKVKVDPATLTSAQINYFLTTPQGAATFQAVIANPLVAQASGVPSNLAAFATANATSISNLLEIPQVAAIIDQVVTTMIAQTPSLAATIAAVAATMPNAATAGGTTNKPNTSATPANPMTSSSLGSTLVK